MTPLKTALNTQSQRFITHQKYMEQRLNQLKKCLNEVQQPRPTKPGKMPVRERIQHLIDPQTDFLELSPLAGYQLYDHPLPAGGILTGIGSISGKTCMIIANDPAVKGGTYFPITIKKHLRAQEIAIKNHLPTIYLVDSGGAFLPKQDEVFPDHMHFGRIFYMQAQMSAMGLPQIAAVMGSCTAGGAYVPAMADETIMVKGNATIFLGGPPLVKAAINESITAEALGGSDLHCRISGLADYEAPDEQAAIHRIRTALSFFKQHQYHTGRITPKPPLYDPKELYGLIPEDLRQPFDMHEVIMRLTDGSLFEAFKASYGNPLICGFAHILGYPVGVIASNGVLFSDSALKATHFIQLCTQRHIPLLFLQHVTGFMIGKQQESAGIAKHGAKLIHAVACAQVPKFTLLIGGSFGAGNYALCGRAYDPNLLFSWPTARIAIMGGPQAAQVLSTLHQNKQSPWTEEDTKRMNQAICEQYQTQSDPLYATARLWDDGIIDPCDTRSILAQAMNMAQCAPQIDTQFGLFRM